MYVRLRVDHAQGSGVAESAHTTTIGIFGNAFREQAARAACVTGEAVDLVPQVYKKTRLSVFIF